MKKLCLLFLPIGLLLGGLSACTEKPMVYISGKVPASHKVAAPVSISYTTPKKVALGENALVTITLKADADVDDLTLSVTAGEGLILPNGNYKVNFGSLTNNSTLTEDVLISSSAEGLLFLNLLVSGSFSGREMARAGAVPVQVGDDVRKMLKTSGALDVDSKGRVLTVSPAEER